MLNNLISNLTNSGVVETTSISTTVAVTTMVFFQYTLLP